MSLYPDRVQPSTALYCSRPHTTTAGTAQSSIPTRPGTDLCPKCHAEFAPHLQMLASILPTLDRAAYRAPNAEYREKVRSSSHIDVGSVWNPAATSALIEIADWTSLIARTLVADAPSDRVGGNVTMLASLGWAEPWRRPPVKILNWTARTLAIAAHQHAEWLTSYPVLGPEFLDHAEKLHVYAMRALDTRPVIRINIPDTLCTTELAEVEIRPGEYGGIVCNSPLVGILTEPTDTRPSTICCSANPAHRRYSLGEWLDIEPGKATS